jgi:hypothetical protein
MPIGDKIEVRRHPLPHVETYDVTADELDRIATESATVGQDFQYCSICLTAAIAFFIAILTTEIKSPRVYQTFLIVTLVGSVLAIYFGQAYMRGKKKSASTIQKIRDRQIGPVGEEGRELRPAQVAELPPVPAPVVLDPPTQTQGKAGAAAATGGVEP